MTNEIQFEDGNGIFYFDQTNTTEVTMEPQFPDGNGVFYIDNNDEAAYKSSNINVEGVYFADGDGTFSVSMDMSVEYEAISLSLW